MTENKQSPHVLQGIGQVIAAFADNGIGKNRKNESQGFKFRGIDDVMNRMAQHLTEASLVIAPNIRSREVHERVNTRGNPLFYVTVQVDYTVYSSIDGSSIVVSVPGEAMDSGDKATNKALSIAYKYMAFQLFAIPIDEDPDATTHVVGKKEAPSTFLNDAPAKPELITMDEAEIITNLIAQAGADVMAICKAYAVTGLGNLPRAVVPEITTRLQKKIKQQTSKSE